MIHFKITFNREIYSLSSPNHRQRGTKAVGSEQCLMNEQTAKNERAVQKKVKLFSEILQMCNKLTKSGLQTVESGV